MLVHVYAEAEAPNCVMQGRGQGVHAPLLHPGTACMLLAALVAAACKAQPNSQQHSGKPAAGTHQHASASQPPDWHGQAFTDRCVLG